MLYKDPRLPPNIHMLSDSCLPRLSCPHSHSLSLPHTASASLNRTGYNRRDPHSSSTTQNPISIQILQTTSTKATKRANYCKTSLITFQLISCLQTAKETMLKRNDKFIKGCSTCLVSNFHSNSHKILAKKVFIHTGN